MNEVLENQSQDVQRLYEIYYKKYPKLKEKDNFVVKRIMNNVFSISLGGKNINWYVNKDGNTILDVDDIRDRANYGGTSDSNSIMDAAGYKLGICEIYNKETGEYEMFRATYTQESNGKLVVKEKGKKIPKDTEEYFRIWRDISFIGYRISLTSGELSDIEYLDRIIYNKALTIFDLLKQKQDGLVSQELFDKYKDEIEKMLPDQIMDSRFTIDSRGWYRLLEKYKTQISKDVYEKSVEQIKRLEAKEKNIQGMLGNQFKAELDILKNGVA